MKKLKLILSLLLVVLCAVNFALVISSRPQVDRGTTPVFRHVVYLPESNTVVVMEGWDPQTYIELHGVLPR